MVLNNSQVMVIDQTDYYFCQSKTVLILLYFFSDKVEVNSDTLKYYLFRAKRELSKLVGSNKSELLKDFKFDNCKPEDILSLLTYFDFEMSVRGPDDHILDHTLAMLDVTKMIEIRTSKINSWDTMLFITPAGETFVKNIKENIPETKKEIWYLFEILSNIIFEIQSKEKDVVKDLYCPFNVA